MVFNMINDLSWKVKFEIIAYILKVFTIYDLNTFMLLINSVDRFKYYLNIYGLANLGIKNI